MFTLVFVHYGKESNGFQAFLTTTHIRNMNENKSFHKEYLFIVCSTL